MSVTLRVVNGSNPTYKNILNFEAWKNIDIHQNVRISNRKDLSKPLEYGETQANILDGKVKTSRNGDGTAEELFFDRLSLSEQKYNLFNKICALDGDASNLTQGDVVMATKLPKDIMKHLGITKVVTNFAKGVVQFILGSGKNDVLTFDFETKNEKDSRHCVTIKEEEISVLDLARKYGIDPVDFLKENRHIKFNKEEEEEFYNFGEEDTQENPDLAEDFLKVCENNTPSVPDATLECLMIKKDELVFIPFGDNYDDCWNDIE